MVEKAYHEKNKVEGNRLNQTKTPCKPFTRSKKAGEGGMVGFQEANSGGWGYCQSGCCFLGIWYF